MPYTQEQYERAKQSLSDPGLPEASRAIRTQRIAEFENDQARGYMREQGSNPPQESKPVSLPATRPQPAQEPGIKSWAQVVGEDAQFSGDLIENSKSPTMDAIRSAMAPEELEARRRATDFAKKLARDEKLPTASKLKVFNAPPKYEPPPPLSSMPFTSKLNPMERYFEPTLEEFKSIALAEGRVGQNIRRQFPDIQKLEDLPDDKLENSDAFKAYADARWQTALANAIKTRTPIVRVAFENPESADGTRPQSLAANFMDGSQALMAGALQGKSMGLYDLGLSGLAKVDRVQNEVTGSEDGSQFEKLRDAQRGSMERHPVLATIGSIVGSVDPRGLPGRLTARLSRVGNPQSLPGRVAKAGAVGAASAVIDDNARAAARLAADALDAEMTATESVAHLMQNLPGFRPSTVALGAGMGAGGDLVGALAGSASRGIQNMDHLQAPLERARQSGVKLSALGEPKVSPGARELELTAARNRTTPAQQVAEDISGPLASQRLLEQEAATRQAVGETAVAQMGLENARLPTHEAGKRIRAITAGPAITRMSENSKRTVNDIANRLMGHVRVSVDELDNFIQQVDQAAGFDKARGKPNAELAAVSKELKGLRDNFAGMEDVTVVDSPASPLELANPVEVLPRPTKAQIAAHRATMQQAAANVTPEEAEAVRKFTRGYDQSIRAMQRGSGDNTIAGQNPRGMEHAAEARAALPLLDSYMKKMPPATDVPVVYRGIVVPRNEADALLKNPEILADPTGRIATTSVSADPIVARSFVARNLEGDKVGIVLKLHHKSAVGAGDFADPKMQVEKELLLPGKARFNVIKRYSDASTPGQFIIEAEEIAEKATPIAGIRDAEGNVKATEGYSALKTRQSKMRRFHEDMNEQMGLPRELSAEPVVTERVDKGLFNTQTPEELVSQQRPEVRLNPAQVRSFGSAIEGTGGLANSGSRKLIKSLAERTGPEYLKKVEQLEQLLDAGDIKKALGRGMEGLNVRTEGMSGILRREQLLRLVPTLESLSGGLPRAPKMEATDAAVKRFREFIPTLKAAAMRGGNPARAVGAGESEQPKGMPKFSDEEAEFWLKVVDKLSREMRPQ